MSEQDLWNERSQRYDDLAWVHRPDLLGWVGAACHAALRTAQAAGCQSQRLVEAGCGTGALTQELDRVRARLPGPLELLAYDLSPAMISRAADRCPQVRMVVADDADIHHEPALGIVSRMVLHHADDPAAACRRWVSRLAPGGAVVIAEGPPPVVNRSHPAWAFYQDVMHLKEPGRHTLTAADIAEHLHAAGCSEVWVRERWTEGNSLRNWLDHATTGDQGTRDRIGFMHLGAALRGTPAMAAVADAYRMRVADDGDVLMRWRHCVVVGFKPLEGR